VRWFVFHGLVLAAMLIHAVDQRLDTPLPGVVGLPLSVIFLCAALAYRLMNMGSMAYVVWMAGRDESFRRRQSAVYDEMKRTQHIFRSIGVMEWLFIGLVEACVVAVLVYMRQRGLLLVEAVNVLFFWFVGRKR